MEKRGRKSAVFTDRATVAQWLNEQGSRIKSLWGLIALGDDTPRFETATPLSAGETL